MLVNIFSRILRFLFFEGQSKLILVCRKTLSKSDLDLPDEHRRSKFVYYNTQFYIAEISHRQNHYLFAKISLISLQDIAEVIFSSLKLTTISPKNIDM